MPLFRAHADEYKICLFCDRKNACLQLQKCPPSPVAHKQLTLFAGHHLSIVPRSAIGLFYFPAEWGNIRTGLGQSHNSEEAIFLSSQVYPLRGGKPLTSISDISFDSFCGIDGGFDQMRRTNLGQTFLVICEDSLEWRMEAVKRRLWDRLAIRRSQEGCLPRSQKMLCQMPLVEYFVSAVISQSVLNLTKQTIRIWYSLRSFF